MTDPIKCWKGCGRTESFIYAKTIAKCDRLLES